MRRYRRIIADADEKECRSRIHHTALNIHKPGGDLLYPSNGRVLAEITLFGSVAKHTSRHRRDVTSGTLDAQVRALQSIRYHESDGWLTRHKRSLASRTFSLTSHEVGPVKAASPTSHSGLAFPASCKLRLCVMAVRVRHLFLALTNEDSRCDAERNGPASLGEHSLLRVAGNGPVVRSRV